MSSCSVSWVGPDLRAGRQDSGMQPGRSEIGPYLFLP